MTQAGEHVLALGLAPRRGSTQTALCCVRAPWGEGAPEASGQTSRSHYCAGLLSFSGMLLCWPELRNGPRSGALNNAGIFFLFLVLCFQTESAPPAVQGEVLGALAKAGWSRGFSLALQLTVPGS